MFVGGAPTARLFIALYIWAQVGEGSDILMNALRAEALHNFGDPARSMTFSIRGPFNKNNYSNSCKNNLILECCFFKKSGSSPLSFASAHLNAFPLERHWESVTEKLYNTHRKLSAGKRTEKFSRMARWVCWDVRGISVVLYPLLERGRENQDAHTEKSIEHPHKQSWTMHGTGYIDYSQ
ncbi:hypothetical protein CBL_10375 [Carabus blaptoides fortunei]